jgi:hypothetical protein
MGSGSRCTPSESGKRCRITELTHQRALSHRDAIGAGSALNTADDAPATCERCQDGSCIVGAQASLTGKV